MNAQRWSTRCLFVGLALALVAALVCAGCSDSTLRVNTGKDSGATGGATTDANGSLDDTIPSRGGAGGAPPIGTGGATTGSGGSSPDAPAIGTGGATTGIGGGSPDAAGADAGVTTGTGGHGGSIGGAVRDASGGLGGVPGTGGMVGGSGICYSSNAGCKPYAPEFCGDGINNQGGFEECDDGNVLPGDGCNGNCKVERNWTCPKAGTCFRNVICGDGRIGPGEVCDDGNTTDGDGCNWVRLFSAT